MTITGVEHSTIKKSIDVTLVLINNNMNRLCSVCLCDKNVLVDCRSVDGLHADQ
jgi:hypothetical protein